MAEETRPNFSRELGDASFGTYAELFGKFRALARKYGDLSPDGMVNAYRSAFGIGRMYTPDPYIQNRRIKGISTRPANYSKEEVGKMLESPLGNEQPLRAVERGLEFTAYPLFNLRTTLQNLLTYHHYIAPEYTGDGAAREDGFWREWRLGEKLCKAMDVEGKAHEIAGQVLQEGKVFYTVRYAVDKSHNRVDHAFLQQLPSDWCKIVGLNNKTKYTVAFNLMYFAQPGTDYRQYGDLFAPFMEDFLDAVEPRPRGLGKTLVFGAKTGLNLRAVGENSENVDAYFQNGRWFYWANLPADRVFTFEMDSTARTVFSPFTGLFIDMIQLSQLEQIQLSLVQNPLVSILHGTIPYWDNRETDKADQYKLSDTGRKFFTALFQDMLLANNTSGIGLFAAPFEDMKLESLSEAPSAMDIVTKGYQDTISKSGMSGIIPAAGDTRAGAVQVSFQIMCQFSKEVYRGMERMMAVLLEGLNLRYEWRFVMFGSLYEDEKLMERAMKGMEHGILSELLIYNALQGRSLLEDLAYSDAVLACNISDKRRPLITSFSAKQEYGLPPQVGNEGGRPKSEGVTSEGQEGDADA